MHGFRKFAVAILLTVTLFPVVRGAIHLVFASCGGQTYVPGTLTWFGPSGNPAGNISGYTNSCTSGVWAQGKAVNSYSNVTMQACDATPAGANCSSYIFEIFPGGVVWSQGDRYTRNANFCSVTINWYNGSANGSTPWF